MMKYDKKIDASIKYYATELCHKDGTDNLLWLRKEPTGWKNYAQVYRELEKASIADERML